ncbi:MAG: outer membrane beta-barrel protein [Bacteroidales bacterium]
MNQDNRHIDQLFKNGLKGVGEKPPVYAWDRLNRDLDKAYTNKPLVYFRWIAAVALILIAFGSGYYIATLNVNKNLQSETINIPSSEIQSPESALSNSTDAIDSNDLLNDIEAPVSSLVMNKPEIKNSEIQNNFIQTDTEPNQNLLESSNTEFSQRVTRLEKISWNSMNMVEFDNVLLNDKMVIGQNTRIDIAKNGTGKFNTGINPINPLNEYQYDDPDKKKSNQAWAVGAQFAPVISYRDISNTYGSQNNGSPDEKSDLNNMEESLLSYAGGVEINFNLNKRWSIQSGAYYSRIGQVNSDALNFKQENNDYLLFSINTSTGNINIAFEKVPDDVRKITPPKDTLEAINIGDVKIVQNFDLFEIPLMLKYKFLHKKLSISFAGGLSPAYLLDNTTYLEVDNAKYDIGSSSNLNSVIINSSFSLGFDVALSKKFSFNMEPTFKYSLNPLNNDSQFDYHPYYFSWFTGVKYKF